MRPTFLCVAILSVACAGEVPVGTDPDPDPDPDPIEDPSISGDITESAIWSGTATLGAEAIIQPGVQVTIAAGTVFEGAQGATLRVLGTLTVEGTSAEPVTMGPVAGATAWAGIVVEAGGQATLSYAQGTGVASLINCKSGAVSCDADHLDFTAVGKVFETATDSTLTASSFVDVSNGAITVSGSGDLTITDTTIMTSQHDLIVQSGGTLLVDHSVIGGAQGSYEHCGFHIGSAQSLTITNSVILSNVYGMMIGGVTGAIIQYNNFMANDPDQDIQITGTVASIDARYNYWDQGTPGYLSGAFDLSAAVGTEYAEAGPRP